MTKEEAIAKYGDAKVKVISTDYFKELFEDYEYRNPDAAEVLDSLWGVNHALEPMLRCEAEFDTNYLQVIPYTVLVCRDPHVAAGNGACKIFTTHRINGDSRLVGQYSIGTGGHIDDTDENIVSAMLRELNEEVGLKEPENGFMLTFPDQVNDFYIYDPSNEVSSVHLGLIIYIYFDPKDAERVKVAEPDKLEGEWLSVHELVKLMSEGKLETWSVDVMERLMRYGIRTIDEEDY